MNEHEAQCTVIRSTQFLWRTFSHGCQSVRTPNLIVQWFLKWWSTEQRQSAGHWSVKGIKKFIIFQLIRENV